MLGGIIFVFIVWFVPMILWLIFQNPFKKNSSCENGKTENKLDKKIFWAALSIGIAILLGIIILA